MKVETMAGLVSAMIAMEGLVAKHASRFMENLDEMDRTATEDILVSTLQNLYSN